MNLIYRLNRWYDELEEPLRFFLFIIPATILVIMGHWPGIGWPNYVGLGGLCLLAIVRILPIFFPDKHKTG